MAVARFADPPGPQPTEAERPDLDEVREWINVDPEVGGVSDEQLARIYWAEVGLQEQYNDVDPYTDYLALALFRRCARAAAARGLPLGTLPVQMTGYPDAYGALIIPRLDAEVERYEGPTRKIAFA